VIKQGHKYDYAGRTVLAMESKAEGVVRVRPIEPTECYPLGREWNVIAFDLKPLPMRYFHDQVPA
jgi:hypothetical protein